MPTVIKHKIGSGAPLASDLVEGELGIDTVNGRAYTENSVGSIVELGANPAGEIQANAGIALPDSQKATFGASDDLQIYHDGSNSFISDQGTGRLGIQTSGLTIQNAAGTGNYITAEDGAEVGLRYNNVQKLATTSTGIDVTGTVTADYANVYSGVLSEETQLRVGYSSANNWAFGRENATTGDFFIKSTDASVDTTRLKLHNNGDVSLYEDTGTTAKFFWDASAESLGIGTSSPAAKLHLNSTSTTAIVFDSDTATQQYELGVGYGGVGTSSFYLYDNTASASRVVVDSSGNVGIGTNASLATANLTTLTLDNATWGGRIELRQGGTAFGKLSWTGFQTGGDGITIEGTERIDFRTSGNHHARIDSSGNLLVGTTTAVNSGHTITKSNASTLCAFDNTNSTAPYGIQVRYSGVNPNNTVSNFYEAYSLAGGTTKYFEVRSNGGIANYQANNANLSDEREKKDIESLDSTWHCVESWDLVKYRYNHDDVDTPQKYGVIAQQVEQHCPEIITEWNKGTAEEPEMRLAVKEQQMTWMAIKALQEAMTRIETLEAEVAALKGA